MHLISTATYPIHYHGSSNDALFHRAARINIKLLMLLLWDTYSKRRCKYIDLIELIWAINPKTNLNPKLTNALWHLDYFPLFLLTFILNSWNFDHLASFLLGSSHTDVAPQWLHWFLSFEWMVLKDHESLIQWAPLLRCGVVYHGFAAVWL